jgi:hypothetical protein
MHRLKCPFPFFPERLLSFSVIVDNISIIVVVAGKKCEKKVIFIGWDELGDEAEAVHQYCTVLDKYHWHQDWHGSAPLFSLPRACIVIRQSENLVPYVLYCTRPTLDLG